MEPARREPTQVRTAGHEMDFQYEPDPRNPLWGRPLAELFVPDWPDIKVVPSKRPFVTSPVGFRCYTRVGREVYSHYGTGYEQTRWELEQQVRNRNNGNT